MDWSHPELASAVRVMDQPTKGEGTIRIGYPAGAFVLPSSYLLALLRERIEVRVPIDGFLIKLPPHPDLLPRGAKEPEGGHLAQLQRVKSLPD